MKTRHSELADIRECSNAVLQVVLLLTGQPCTLCQTIGWL